MLTGCHPNPTLCRSSRFGTPRLPSRVTSSQYVTIGGIVSSALTSYARIGALVFERVRFDIALRVAFEMFNLAGVHGLQ
jgi:hypothetical protein